MLLRVASLSLAVASAALAHEGDHVVVVTSLPYLAEVARAIGGEEVQVESLVPPGTDPHFLVPTPALSVTLAKADVYLENGFQLELWSERVIDGARNQKIRVGSPGHCYTGNGVLPIQVPAQTTRAQGDVHPAGNPHIWLDPLNLKVVAKNVETCLAGLVPRATAAFAENRKRFEAELDKRLYGPELVRILGATLLDRLHRTGRLRGFLAEKQYQGKPLAEQAGGWLKRALALGELRFISYHQDWMWFANAFGLTLSATVEEKPGIPPSPAHLEALETKAAAERLRVVVYSPFYPAGRAESVAESIGGVAVMLPTQPGEAEEAKDLWSLYDAVFSRLEQAQAKVAAAGR